MKNELTNALPSAEEVLKKYEEHISYLTQEQKDMYKQVYEMGKSFFIYVPPQPVEPVAYNVNIGYKMRDYFMDRIGKRYIKIKRFGKTRRYYTTKWAKSYGRTLNDKWLMNLQG